MGNEKKKAFLLFSSPSSPSILPRGLSSLIVVGMSLCFVSQLLALGEAEEGCERLIEAAANRLSCATRLINILIKYVTSERTARFVVVCRRRIVSRPDTVHAVCFSSYLADRRRLAVDNLRVSSLVLRLSYVSNALKMICLLASFHWGRGGYIWVFILYFPY